MTSCGLRLKDFFASNSNYAFRNAHFYTTQPFPNPANGGSGKLSN
jgi:hypothetical protein